MPTPSSETTLGNKRRAAHQARAAIALDLAKEQAALRQTDEQRLVQHVGSEAVGVKCGMHFAMDI